MAQAPTRIASTEPHGGTNNSHYVSPAQFCELLTSRRNLDRCDQPDAMHRGLVDRAIGVRFLVLAAELEKHERSKRQSSQC